jgi:protein O-GlcNAc transferase
MTPEFQLLLACAHRLRSQENDAAIRRLLSGDIDWTVFVRTVIGQGFAASAEHMLNCVAPDLVPAEIRAVLATDADKTRRGNGALLDELLLIAKTLESSGISVIACRGPTLAIQAYGDLGFGTVEDLHILINDSDLTRTTIALHSLGYERRKQLSAAQLDLICRLQGCETLCKKASRTGVRLHIRLTPGNMAIDLDCDGLRRRAICQTFQGRTVTTLSAEDNLIGLSILAANELWFRASRACDVAAFIVSHPGLDWTTIVKRARSQGVLRRLLLTVTLAHYHFGAPLSYPIVTAEQADGKLARLRRQVVKRWQVDELVDSDDGGFSLERLSLHDGWTRGGRYVGHSLILPRPHHIARNPFPRLITSIFAYSCFKIAHDIALLPLLRLCRYLYSRAKRFRNTLMSFKVVLVILPGSAEERRRLHRHHEAWADAKRELGLDPNNAKALHDLGNALHGLSRHKAAIACYDRAIVMEPSDTRNWRMRRAALVAIDKKSELLDFASESRDVTDWIVRACVLFDMRAFAEASDASDRALSLDPTNMAAMNIGVQSRRNACDWRKREEDERRSAQCKITHSRFCATEADNLVFARHTGKKHQRSTKPLWRGETYRHDKIRIAYVTSYLHLPFPITEFFEHHDRTRFEIILIFVGNSRMSEGPRCKAAFDRVIDAHAMGDAEVAEILRDLETDIAVDLNGYIGDRSTRILSARPAPIQVNYWGHTGTLGVPFIDYIIADRIVIPEENRIHYSENVVYLPCCYQPNLRSRPIAEETPSRADVGLPETGFVFSSFNKSYKITPEVFEIWMRLLRAVENSVLWLVEDNPSMPVNLRREAKARGVLPERLVFAPRKPPAEYLAQQRLADLFLDTIPINAHATASDALFMGLPVLTCTGNTFTSRVGTSLLNAVGLAELATSSLDEYEELARALALHPDRLAALKAKLLRNRDTKPLFDPAGYMRQIESAYTTIWERQQAGSPPADFAVPS